MVEGDLLEAELGVCAAPQELPPREAPAVLARRAISGLATPGLAICGLVEVGHVDDVLHGGKLLENALDDGRAVEVLAAVAIAVDREDHLGLDLGEAIDHAPRAELGGRAGPRRS